MKVLYALIVLFSLASCNNSPGKLGEEEKAAFLISGDGIANYAQANLLQNVSHAIEMGGVLNAIDFCSKNAIPITDSISAFYAKDIQRLSDKNRNPANAIQTDLDQKAWEEIKAFMADSTKAKHLVLEDKSAIYYYKAITIGMPTCLSCHGDQNIDIKPEALQLINQKYPSDKAIGYKMGELRGMWKIKLN